MIEPEWTRGTCGFCEATGLVLSIPEEDGDVPVCAACLDADDPAWFMDPGIPPMPVEPEPTQNQTAEQPHLFAFPTGIRGQLTLEG